MTGDGMVMRGVCRVLLRTNSNSSVAPGPIQRILRVTVAFGAFSLWPLAR
jgi:hypothetical protein